MTTTFIAEPVFTAPQFNARYRAVLHDGGESTPDDALAAVHQHVEAVLDSAPSEDVSARLPTVTTVADLSQCKVGQVVRYIGMVQDINNDGVLMSITHDEAFVEADGAGSSNSGTGAGEAQASNSSNNAVGSMGYANCQQQLYTSMQLLYVVPLPGTYDTQLGLQRYNRIASETVVEAGAAHAGGRNPRRGREDDPTIGSMEEGERAKRRQVERSTSTVQSMNNDETASVSSSFPNPTNTLNLPEGTDADTATRPVCITQRPCIKGVEDPRLNEVVEIIGVVTALGGVGASTANDGFGGEGIDDDIESFTMAQFEKVSSTMCLRFTAAFVRPYIVGLPSPSRAIPSSEIGYANVVQYLTNAVTDGDALLARYLLCHLASGVYARTEGGCMPLGDFPLNVYTSNSRTGTPQQRSNLDTLRRRLRWLCAPSPLITLELDEATLTTESLVPLKDFERNCIVTGALQLPACPVFLHLRDMMHTNTAESLTSEKALRRENNVSALVELAQRQRVTYKFPYSPPIVNDVNAKTIIFTEGRQSIVDVHSVVMWVPAEGGAVTREVESPHTQAAAGGGGSKPSESTWSEKAEPATLDDPSLVNGYGRDLLLAYLHQLPPVASVEVDKANGLTDQFYANQLQHDKQTSPSEFNSCPVISQNTFFVRMGLARLLAILLHRVRCGSVASTPVLSKEAWEEMRMMERARVARLE